MRAIITVIGKDTVGILAKVSGECANNGANIIEVTQSVLQDLFVMVMIVDTSKLSCKLAELGDKMNVLGKDNGFDVRVMNEDLFNSMHRI